MQDQYNAQYPAYAKDCLEDNSGTTRLLTGQTLTKEQMAELEANKKERDERCKPKADRPAQLQRDILATQQITNASTAIAHLLKFLLPPAIIAISDAAVRTTEPEMKKFAPTTPSNPISAVAQLRTFSTIAATVIDLYTLSPMAQRIPAQESVLSAILKQPSRRARIGTVRNGSKKGGKRPANPSTAQNSRPSRVFAPGH